MTLQCDKLRLAASLYGWTIVEGDNGTMKINVARVSETNSTPNPSVECAILKAMHAHFIGMAVTNNLDPDFDATKFCGLCGHNISFNAKEIT